MQDDKTTQLLLDSINRLTNKLENYIEAHTNMHQQRADKINEEHQRIWVDISALKVKATVWGGLGGAIVVAVSLLTSFLKQ